MPPSFHPEWLPRASERWGAGLELDCPVHIGGCRVVLWFHNPCDGLEPMGTGPRYTRRGTGLGSLSVVEKLELGDHGAFWLRAGCVVMRLR